MRPSRSKLPSTLCRREYSRPDKRSINEAFQRQKECRYRSPKTSRVLGTSDVCGRTHESLAFTAAIGFKSVVVGMSRLTQV